MPYCEIDDKSSHSSLLCGVFFFHNATSNAIQLNWFLYMNYRLHWITANNREDVAISMLRIPVLINQQRSKHTLEFFKKKQTISISNCLRFHTSARYYFDTRMSSGDITAPLLLRLVSNACNIANTAGGIVRKVLKSGELDVVDKVRY